MAKRSVLYRQFKQSSSELKPNIVGNLRLINVVHYFLYHNTAHRHNYFHYFHPDDLQISEAENLLFPFSFRLKHTRLTSSHSRQRP